MNRITACMTDEETNTSYLFSSCLKDGANWLSPALFGMRTLTVKTLSRAWERNAVPSVDDRKLSENASVNGKLFIPFRFWENAPAALAMDTGRNSGLDSERRRGTRFLFGRCGSGEGRMGGTNPGKNGAGSACKWKREGGNRDPPATWLEAEEIGRKLSNWFCDRKGQRGRKGEKRNVRPNPPPNPLPTLRPLVAPAYSLQSCCFLQRTFHHNLSLHTDVSKVIRNP